MNIEIPINGQPANGGNIPPVQPQNTTVQPSSTSMPTPTPPQSEKPVQQSKTPQSTQTPPQSTPQSIQTPPQTPPQFTSQTQTTQPLQQNTESEYSSIKDSELLRINEKGGINVDQNRLVADARREMQQRGVIVVPGSQNMNMFLQQYGQQVRYDESQLIKNKYDYSRQLLDEERDEEFNEIEEWKENEIKKIAQMNPSYERNDLEKTFELKHGKEYREKRFEVQENYFKSKKEIEKEEEYELKNSDKELVNAIKELTRYFQQEAKGSVNENSLLNQLKREQEQAIFERDNAEDEETAREASARVNALRERIKDIQGEREEDEGEGEEFERKDYGARILQMIGGVTQFSSGMMNRNVGGMITGLGSVVTNILPLSDENQAGAMKWLSTAGVIGSILSQPIEKENSLAGLAALLRGRNSQENTRRGLYDVLDNYNADNGYLPGIYSLGMDVVSFSKSAERRISQSGIGGNRGLQQAYYQEALERGLSLQSGSLGAAGVYDRYGVSSTDAIASLTSALMRDRYSGVTQGNYARMEEYLKLQQGIMQGQMNFAGTPSYDYANEMVSRFANMKGYQVDQRTGGDIQSLQNMVLNPGNDRQKAILYSVIEKMAPETRGRMDLIERYAQNPKNMVKIQQEYIKRVQEMYGGTNTEMGYYAAKAALPGIASPERRDAVWNGMQTNNFAPVKINEEEKIKYIEDISNYVNDMTEKLTEISESFTKGINWIVNKIEDLTR